MARIPWEMLTLPNVISPDIDIPTVHARSFLGLAENYGVTRQLQTSFAPMPEREKKRTTELSVLIVGDPAPDASLRGAHREALWLRDFLNGDAVQREFEKVTIKFLDGPNATRANLARELCNRSYDILHFAGHCYYNNDAPAKSGWVFRASPLEVFTADELMRLDRVPSFIFSNACESGITPDRAREANLDLSPAFAEAFFAKGVGNLICTGWPVNDRAALAFTEEFYTSTLINGLSIREAAQNARRKAADLSFQTAGAYQHYGSPSARIIPPTPAKANTRTASRNPRTIS